MLPIIPVIAKTTLIIFRMLPILSIIDHCYQFKFNKNGVLIFALKTRTLFSAEYIYICFSCYALRDEPPHRY